VLHTDARRSLPSRKPSQLHKQAHKKSRTTRWPKPKQTEQTHPPQALLLPLALVELASPRTSKHASSMSNDNKNKDKASSPWTTTTSDLFAAGAQRWQSVATTVERSLWSTFDPTYAAPADAGDDRVPPPPEVEEQGNNSMIEEDTKSIHTVSTSTTDDDDEEEESGGDDGVEWTFQDALFFFGTSKSIEKTPPHTTTATSTSSTIAAAVIAKKNQPTKLPSKRQRRRRRRPCALWICMVLTTLMLLGGGAVTYFMLQKDDRNELTQSAIEDETPPTTTTTTRTEITFAPVPPSPLPTTTAPSLPPVTFNPTTAAPTPYQTNVVTFAAIGDVPYTPLQHEELKQQIQNLDPAQLDFVVHVGDLRDAQGNPTCYREQYEEIGATLAQSRVPVLVLVGDNDTYDCPNFSDGLSYWRDVFVGFEGKYWTPPFEVTRSDSHAENFSFVYKDVLFVGVDLVGGEDDEDWETHLQQQVDWTLELISAYDLSLQQYTGRVVLLGHADPKKWHDTYFDSLTAYLNRLENPMPVLYLNGDGHKWSYDEGYKDTPSLMRIMLRGEAVEPPTIVRVLASGDPLPLNLAFSYDRGLEDEHEDERR